MHYPDLTRSVARAAEAGLPLEPALAGLANSLGFETFTYTPGLPRWNPCPANLLLSTNCAFRWFADWDRNAYVEIDPRFDPSAVDALIWDQQTTPSLDVRQFVHHSAAYGVRSGFVVPLDDADRVFARLSFEGSREELGAARRKKLTALVAQLQEVAQLLGAHYSDRAANVDVPSRCRLLPLNHRERAVVTLLGQQIEPVRIAELLRMRAEFVAFHCASLCEKLRVSTIEEAVRRTYVPNKGYAHQDYV